MQKKKLKIKNKMPSNSSEKFLQAMYNIQCLVNPFIKQIIMDYHNDPDSLYYKTGLDNDIYKIGIYNKKTNKTAIKNYTLTEILTLMQQSNKFEFEMNKVIRELVSQTENSKENQISI